MKLLQFYKGEEIALGILTDKGVIDVAAAAAKLGVEAPGCMMCAIRSGADGMAVLEQIEAQATDYLAEVRYAPAVTGAEKVICVGLNYRKHAIETNFPIPSDPILFNKFATSLNAHEGTVELSKNYVEYDYEAELVLVIGKTAKNVSVEEAKDYIFGVTAGNDVSNRYLQKNRGGQWLNGKACDGFGPIGPCVVTGLDGDNLAIKLYKNGQLRQDSNTNDLIFDTARLVSYISETITLHPGDVIFTGTPSGVIMGLPEGQQDWLKAGDVVDVEIEGIGTLRSIMA